MAFLESLAVLFSPEKKNAVMRAYDFSRRHLPKRVFAATYGTATIITKELKWPNSDALIACLLNYIPENSAVFGKMGEDYLRFSGTVRERVGKMFSPTAADLFIKLVKPFVDGRRFDNKAEVHNFHCDLIGQDNRSTLLKMVDRLYRLRAAVKSENKRCLNQSGLVSRHSQKVLEKIERRYLPLFVKQAKAFAKDDLPEHRHYYHYILRGMRCEMRKLRFLNSGRLVWAITFRTKLGLTQRFYPEKKEIPKTRRTYSPIRVWVNNVFFKRLIAASA